jgi:hypothetical protein
LISVEVLLFSSELIFTGWKCLLLCCYVPAFELKTEHIDAMQKIQLCNGDLCDDLDCT